MTEFLNNQKQTYSAAPKDKPAMRAAMYVRMSTDHQRYSTENQAAAIEEYAARRGIEIVKTYTDSGKSGLTIDGRDALLSLIDDVQNGRAEFNSILVLDVTRWGRFQDADESAYYEYICRRAGIDVQYVAEQFENDGSSIATIVKNVKRAMAGEYSRELSGKVFAGQCRLIEKGYKQGGMAGFGLRRMMIDEHGNPKEQLVKGQRKSFQTDRVILVPGPQEEVETVRWIYNAFVNERMIESEIAARVNQRGILTPLDRPWTRGTIHEILTNEKYIGNNVFNRISYKLKMRRVVNPADMWVRKDGAFEAIVDPAQFYTAQGMIRERSRRFSDDEMLDKLRALHDRQGWLSGIVINETENMPSTAAYAHRFGSLIRAYELVGFSPDRDYRYIEINKYLRRMYPDIVENTIKKIEEFGGKVHREVGSDFLHINDEITAAIVICRCYKTSGGSNRWKVRLDTGLMPDITVIVRMDPANTAAQDYYLLPALDIENPQIRLADHNHMALDAYRFDDLEPFFMLAERAALPEAA